eukprot:TRINITY_DN12631_c1_g2_i4.p1 TRINITY_DN12631_c1_g2~~TRINITY_DN12631_c1_g2_i4.p1  ORF type:complete len:220 (+),score=16.86 TRINITY_DN12631_c1_g2_i4:785-1444(+)
MADKSLKDFKRRCKAIRDLTEAPDGVELAITLARYCLASRITHAFTQLPFHTTSSLAHNCEIELRSLLADIMDVDMASIKEPNFFIANLPTSIGGLGLDNMSTVRIAAKLAHMSDMNRMIPKTFESHKQDTAFNWLNQTKPADFDKPLKEANKILLDAGEPEMQDLDVLSLTNKSQKTLTLKLSKAQSKAFIDDSPCNSDSSRSRPPKAAHPWHQAPPP